MVSDDLKKLLAMDLQAQKDVFTPSHPFTPDVVEWARDVVAWDEDKECPWRPDSPHAVKAARQILAAVGEG